MRWKWIILGVVGLMVLCVIAVYVILSTYNFNSLKPQITRIARERTGRDLQLAGDIRLKIGLIPALMVENASFQNAPWGSRPEMARIRRFEMHVALVPLLSKRIELKKLILVEPDILVESNPSGQSNLDFASQKKEVPEKQKQPPSTGEMKLPSFVVNEFEISKGLVTYRDGRSGKTTTLGLEQLSLKAENLDSPTKVKLKASYGGQSIEAEGTVGPLSAIMDAGKPWPIQISGKAFDAAFTVKGTVKDVTAQRALDFGFTLTGSDLASLGKASGQALPIKGPYDVSGRLSTPAQDTYRISNLKAALAGTDLAGTMEAHLAGQRPRLTASLSSKRLDLRSIMSEPAQPGETGKTERKGASPPGKTSRGDRLLPNDPLPLDSLGQADAEIKFQGVEILLPMLSLSNLALDMGLKNGRLGIKPLKAQFAGGSLQGELDLQSRGRDAMLGVEIKADQLDVGRLFKELKGFQPLEGRLNADLSVKGQGASVAALMGSLNGKSVMTISEGKIDNKYLDALGGDMGSALLRLLGVSRDTPTTALHCFVSGFTIKDGRADTTALVADTDQVSLIGDGEINLKNETLNLTLNPLPKGTTGGGRTSRIASSLMDMARTFKLEGTFAHPSIGVDTTQTAISIGKLVGKERQRAEGADTTPSGDRKLCPEAMEAARKGVKMASVKPERKAVPGTPPTSEESIKQIGKELQKFFRR